MRYAKYIYITLLLIISSVGHMRAQLNPMDAQFFQNPYLANPAQAGLQFGARLNFGSMNQWNSIPGSPRTQYASYDMSNTRVGWGLTVFNDKAGLYNYTKVSGTYAYHLPLNYDRNAFHFGLNLNVYSQNLSLDQLKADQDDLDLVNFNSQQSFLDSDAGFLYTSEKLQLEAVFYNLNNQLNLDSQNIVDDQLSFFAATYSFQIKDWLLKSKIAYRGVRNFTDIVDIGLNATTFDQNFNFTVIYHSSKSASFGFGYIHRKTWEVLGVYNTPNTSLRNYANGTFEVGLKVNLIKQLKKIN